MAIFHINRYDIRDKNTLNAIKKYNKDCIITKINDVDVENLKKCSEYTDSLDTDDKIQIETRSSNTNSLNGILPPFSPIPKVEISEDLTHNLTWMKRIIKVAISNRRENSAYMVLSEIPKFSLMRGEETVRLLNELNNDYPIEGALNIESEKKIIFQIKHPPLFFIIDYSASTLSAIPPSIGFDLDAGFYSLEIDGFKDSFFPQLNENFFLPWKNNGYENDLFPKTKAGLKELDRIEISRAVKKIKLAQIHIKGQDNNFSKLTQQAIVLIAKECNNGYITDKEARQIASHVYENASPPILTPAQKKEARSNHYRKIFFETYEKCFLQDQKSHFGLFSWFRRKKIKYEWSLTQIIDHAKEYNNRSRKVCISLGWMNKDGSITENAPTEIKNQYPSDALKTTYKSSSTG